MKRYTSRFLLATTGVVCMGSIYYSCGEKQTELQKTSMESYEEMTSSITQNCSYESIVNSGSGFKRLTLYNFIIMIFPDLCYLLFAILGSFGAAFYNIQIPILFGDLVNRLANLSSTSESLLHILRDPSVRLLWAFSLQSVCTFIYIGFLATFGERIACRLQNLLFERILFQNVSFFDKNSAGWLTDRIFSDVQEFKSSFKLCVSQGLKSGAQIVGSAIAMYMISPSLTCALLGCFPLVFITGSQIGGQLRRLSIKAHEQSNRAKEIASETFSHIRSVKSLAMEPYLLRSYSKEVSVAGSLHEKLGYGIGFFQGLSNLALNGVVLGVLYFGGNCMAKQELNAGQLMSFLVATQTVHRSLAQISLLFGNVIRGASAAERISQFLSMNGPDEVWAYTNGLKKMAQPFLCSHAYAPSVTFDSVSFAYPDRPSANIFENLTFTIPAGKVVALVGESGAGKSTILSLLERFHDPSAGRILIDQVDLRDFSLSVLRGQLLSYISQEPELFHTTVLENIQCASTDSSLNQVISASALAEANQFIEEQLPDGYYTIVGGGSSTGSSGLSGGQRQRLVIARALLKSAPILLLDEATSALDADSEFKVQSALRNAMSGRTVLIVAHRLSTIKSADLILVMHKGKIVEKGSHGELMRLRGRYFNLIQRQGGGDLLD